MAIRYTLNMTQRHQLASLMEKHLTVFIEPDQPKFCRYEEGWNDERVAKEIGLPWPLAEKAVGNTRRVLFGPVKTIKSSPDTPPDARVGAMNIVLADAMTRLATVEAMLKRMAPLLALLPEEDTTTT